LISFHRKKLHLLIAKEHPHYWSISEIKTTQVCTFSNWSFDQRCTRIVHFWD